MCRERFAGGSQELDFGTLQDLSSCGPATGSNISAMAGTLVETLRHWEEVAGYGYELAPECVAWAEPFGADLASAWRTCPVGEWLVIIARACDAHELARRAALGTAKTVLVYLASTDPVAGRVVDHVESNLWSTNDVAELLSSHAAAEILDWEDSSDSMRVRSFSLHSVVSALSHRLHDPITVTPWGARKRCRFRRGGAPLCFSSYGRPQYQGALLWQGDGKLDPDVLPRGLWSQAPHSRIGVYEATFVKLDPVAPFASLAIVSVRVGSNLVGGGFPFDQTYSFQVEDRTETARGHGGRSDHRSSGIR